MLLVVGYWFIVIDKPVYQFQFMVYGLWFNGHFKNHTFLKKSSKSVDSPENLAHKPVYQK